MIAGKGNPLGTLQSNSDPHKHQHHHHSHTHGHGDHNGGGLSTQESSLYTTNQQHEQALGLYEPSLKTSSSVSVDMLPFPAGGGRLSNTIYSILLSLLYHNHPHSFIHSFILLLPISATLHSLSMDT